MMELECLISDKKITVFQDELDRDEAKICVSFSIIKMAAFRHYHGKRTKVLVSVCTCKLNVFR